MHHLSATQVHTHTACLRLLEEWCLLGHMADTTQGFPRDPVSSHSSSLFWVIGPDMELPHPTGNSVHTCAKVCMMYFGDGGHPGGSTSASPDASMAWSPGTTAFLAVTHHEEARSRSRPPGEASWAGTTIHPCSPRSIQPPGPPGPDAAGGDVGAPHTLCSISSRLFAPLPAQS